MNTKQIALKTKDTGLPAVSMSSRPLPHEPGDRRCLKCNEMFRSKSAANRICKKCTKINASLKINEAQLARQRGTKRLNGELIDRQDTYEMNFF